MKLSKTQERALTKLTNKWQNSYQLQENRNTLNSLVKLGLAKKKNNIGIYFMPRISILYKKGKIE